jgi:hypothetical protein
MCKRHPYQEEAAQGVEFGAAFKAWKLHANDPELNQGGADVMSLDAFQGLRLSERFNDRRVEK